MNISIDPAFITVCTPTYNRARYLTRLFESLKSQRFTNFEWLVIDDGSVDDTANVVRAFIEEAVFRIVYIHQENSGKHIAINRGLDAATGELFLIIDSDDYCAQNGLSVVADEWMTVSERSDICGVTCLNRDEAGLIIGTKFPHERHVAKLTEYYEQHRIRGDKCNAIKTAIFREFMFPQTVGEKFCPESLVWNRMAEQYNTLFVNKVVNVVEYLGGGLSANIIRIRANSPKNTMCYYQEYFHGNRKFILKLKGAVNYFRFALHGGRLGVALLSHPFFGMGTIFPAIAFFLLDRVRLRKARSRVSADSLKGESNC
jgi:glycosyltransferase involved in cell wall biosynthesis